MGLVALIATATAFLVAAIILAIFTVLLRDKAKIRDTWIVYSIQFLILGAILVPAYFGGIFLALALAILATLSLLEYLSIQKGVPAIVKVILIAFSLATFVVAHFFSFPSVYLVIPLATAALLVASLFYVHEQNFFHSSAYGIVGLIYIPVFLSHIILIRKMEMGFLIIFFMYGVSEINDSFAYLFGKMLGKKKIFPNVSPHKTYAGFFSGIIAASMVALILNLVVTRFSPAYAIAAASVTICFTVLGDLVSSKIKRALNVKDFSSLIPRIGGVMDAYDSLIFISPFVFYLSSVIRK